MSFHYSVTSKCLWSSFICM